MDDLESSSLKYAAVRYQGLSYQRADDDPISLPLALSAGIGRDTKESIDNEFRRIEKEAKANGLSSTGQTRLSNLLERHRDVFRIRLGPDPPAKVTPLRIVPVNG